MKSRKESFTLLEVMLSLLILSIIAGLITIQIPKLLSAHRFEREIDCFFIALQEAQLLALTYQTDLAVDLSCKKGVCSYQFTTAEPFSKSFFNQEKVTLKETKAISFQRKKIKNTLHFDLFSDGTIEPRGILAFSFPPEEKSLYVDLQYGSLIKFSHKKPPLYKNSIPEGVFNST